MTEQPFLTPVGYAMLSAPPGPEKLAVSHFNAPEPHYIIPTPNIMLDLDLDEDERATLRRFTTMRRGHGERAVWIVDEIGGEP